MENIQLDHLSHKSCEKKHNMCFFALDISLPDNVGSLFRIADALGVEKILFAGTSVCPPNAKIRKVSRSTDKYVPFTYEKSPLKAIDDLKAKNYRIICLEITSSSVALERLELEKNDKICIVLGSERKGICQEILDCADISVHIPMLGRNSSMNVANACAIAAYQIVRQI